MMNRALRMRRVALVALAVGVTALTAASLASARTVGKNPGEIKGRWLRIEDEAKLSAVRSVYLGTLTADIQWKKAQNESKLDEDLLVEKMHEQLLKRLRESGALGTVLDGPPAKGETGAVRIDAELIVEPGSRAARYVVGMGAGKSRSILELEINDHASGDEIAHCHGYGVGSGMGFKIGGGGARKMTQDDIQEFSKKLVELIAQVK